MKHKPTPAGIVILVSGFVIVIASFFAFYTFKTPQLTFGSTRVGGTASFNAWDKVSLFPVSILPAICGLLMGTRVATLTWSDLRIADRVLGLAWQQLHLVLGFQAAIVMIAFLIRDNSALSFGFGFWLMLVASIGLAVGAVMLNREPATATGPAAA